MLGVILVVSRSLTVMSKYNKSLSGPKAQPRNPLTVSEIDPATATALLSVGYAVLF